MRASIWICPRRERSVERRGRQASWCSRRFPVLPRRAIITRSTSTRVLRDFEPTRGGRPHPTISVRAKLPVQIDKSLFQLLFQIFYNYLPRFLTIYRLFIMFDLVNHIMGHNSPVADNYAASGPCARNFYPRFALGDQTPSSLTPTASSIGLRLPPAMPCLEQLLHRRAISRRRKIHALVR